MSSDSTPALLLDRKRRNQALGAEDIRELVDGVVAGTWGEAEAAAFLMAAAIHGLNSEETQTLVSAMVDSGESWRLADDVPGVVDKHSTGGVGDKVSLIFAPLLAEVGVPVAMLTGRALGHTGGTADKLETIPGLSLSLDRAGMVRRLEDIGVAIGMATENIAPADRVFYGLRDRTGTVPSLPLVTSSIVSKKVALGCAAVVYDVKTGSGAIFPDPKLGKALLHSLVDTTRAAGVASSGYLTDMSQPLGNWVGHSAEVAESVAVLSGEGPQDLIQVTLALAAEACRLVDRDVSEEDLRQVLRSGAGRERFLRWTVSQGADERWAANPIFDIAPIAVPIVAQQSGVLASVHVRRLGWLIQGKAFAGGNLDPSVSLRSRAQIGDVVSAGDTLATAYLRHSDDEWIADLGQCWEVDQQAKAPPLIHLGVAKS